MAETPVSLLDRLRTDPDEKSWQRLLDLYTPLIRRWLGRFSLQPADFEDLVQEVLRALVEHLPAYQRQRVGAFRNWLRTIAINQVRMHWRRRRRAYPNDMENIEDPDNELNHCWDQEHDQHVCQRLLELIAVEFSATTQQAFRLLVLEECPAEEVAAELGISLNAVYIAKSRVLARLRQESRGLLD